ncbi:extracellular solute-binding protein [Saccharopolyspora sp. K220]|uniref:extracellular solute-binding protein n=1 Tax=Saccharopolyspora soli TaxID=2926618 RepID=UPI001F56112D|nr:extracellular solute-binding protein [Saccharopolyspora soli]MCI2421757.1 extracellular solute-binding protein [Saccharopolyspora soli]
MTVLNGMAWSHQRGLGCLEAVSAGYARRHPGVRINWDRVSPAEFEGAHRANEYDLIAMEHPYIGQAHADAALVPLETVLPAHVLAQQRESSVGPSFASYTWAGSQWAVAVDATAQVSAYRADLLGWHIPPVTWDEVTACLKALPPGHKAVLPADPIHLLCSLLTLCAQLGGSGWLDGTGLDPNVAVPAAERLLHLLKLVEPWSLDVGAVEALEAMSTGAVAYAPMVFGDVSYARELRYADIPSPNGALAGSLFDGIGLAISATSEKTLAAARFLAHAVSAECQRGEYVRAGGQPGNRAAWTDPDVDAAAGGFFSATLRTLDRAFARPRDVAYPVVHRRVAEEIHRMVRRGVTAREIVSRCNEVWTATYAEHGSVRPESGSPLVTPGRPAGP